MLTLHDPGPMPTVLALGPAGAGQEGAGEGFARLLYLRAYQEGARQAERAVALFGARARLAVLPAPAGIEREIPLGLRRGFEDRRDGLSPIECGRAARQDGLPLAACPFLFDSDSGLEFELGWREIDLGLRHQATAVAERAA